MLQFLAKSVAAVLLGGGQLTPPGACWDSVSLLCRHHERRDADADEQRDDGDDDHDSAAAPRDWRCSCDARARGPPPNGEEHAP